jgi:hypothetical protein
MKRDVNTVASDAISTSQFLIPHSHKEEHDEHTKFWIWSEIHMCVCVCVCVCALQYVEQQQLGSCMICIYEG